jgi:dipeptidyl aminopeptidase/acylaminoacyl peptidase
MMIAMVHTPSDAPGFHDMFVAQPRLVDLVLAPDGTRLIALAQTINHEGTGYTPGLWEVDLSGAREMRLVAESAQGAFAPAFAADGTLLFLSGRELPDYSETESVSWGPSLRALSEQGEVELVARHQEASPLSLPQKRAARSPTPLH